MLTRSVPRAAVLDRLLEACAKVLAAALGLYFAAKLIQAVAPTLLVAAALATALTLGRRYWRRNHSGGW